MSNPPPPPHVPESQGSTQRIARISDERRLPAENLPNGSTSAESHPTHTASAKSHPTGTSPSDDDTGRWNLARFVLAAGIGVLVLAPALLGLLPVPPGIGWLTLNTSALMALVALGLVALATFRAPAERPAKTFVYFCLGAAAVLTVVNAAVRTPLILDPSLYSVSGLTTLSACVSILTSLATWFAIVTGWQRLHGRPIGTWFLFLIPVAVSYAFSSAVGFVIPALGFPIATMTVLFPLAYFVVNLVSLATAFGTLALGRMIGEKSARSRP